MYNSDNLIDEEQFIRDNLSFLNESDDFFFEISDNTSIRFQSYEECNNVYGTSPISSKVNETWSSVSSGSITSSRETLSRYSGSSNSYPSSLNNFCKEEWYSPFSVEDLYFGQNLASKNTNFLTRCNDNLYKIWNTQANFPLNRATTYDVNRQYERFYDFHNNLGSKIWSNTNFPGSNFEVRTNTNYFDAFPSKNLNANVFPPAPPLPPGFNRFIDEQKLNPRNFVAPLSTEEVLNRYFTRLSNVERQKRSSSESNSFGLDFACPIGRTSTPINTTPIENKPVVTVEQRNTTLEATRSVETENDDKEVAGAAQVSNETKPEDFKVPKIVKPEQNARSVKSFEFCKFCYKNGELSSVYLSHVTKSVEGNTMCPILRKYVCDICGATGDNAHTRKYCPKNSEPSPRPPIFRRLTNGVLTSSHNHK